MNNQLLNIIADINNENIKVVDILEKYGLCRNAFYKIIRENKLFITVERKRGKQIPLLNTHDKKYNFYLEFLELYKLKEEGVYKGPIRKFLCEKYEITYPTFQKVYYEMLDFHNEMLRQHNKIMERIQVFNKYRSNPPRSKDGQLELFIATYDYEVLTTKELVVKAYCNLYFRSYYNNAIVECKQYLEPMIKKYDIVLFTLDKWIQYKKGNNKLLLPPLKQ
jgi:hypothetical protein